jgi:hypothetical protein
MRTVIVIAALAALVPQHVLAGGRSASMGVSANVQRSATFRVIDTFQQLTTSNIDFSRGYVDVPGMLQLVVNPGSSQRRVLNVTVEVEPNPDMVRAIQMRARSDDAANVAGKAAGEPGSGDEASNISLGYRVMLTDRARDGSFTVPVTLTVNL